MIKSTMANTEALTRILLAHLKSEPLPAGGPYRAPPKEAAAPAAKAASAKDGGRYGFVRPAVAAATEASEDPP